MDLKRWLILVSIFVLFFALYQAADAKTFDTVIIDFDEQTLERGFTVKSVDKQLWVPIFPNFHQGKLLVKISRNDNFDDLPETKRAVSGFYTFDIRKENPGFMERAQLISMAYESDNELDKAIYFYDNHQQKWRELPSEIDYENKLIRAKTIFPYAKVAVLENDPEALTAQSAIVVDKNSGSIIFQKNMNDVRPIASMTKLVSVLVFLDHNPGWDKIITMQKSDYVGGASLWAKEGDQITVKDLFYATLVGSKNNTTHSLVRASGLTLDEFVQKMNEKVKGFGLTNTHFVEPTGLNENNVSTAFEMAAISKRAFKNIDILKATTTKWYKVVPVNKDVVYWVKNTSIKLLDRDLYVTGSKTGWTDEAGYNLVMQAKGSTRELIALVMGAKIRMNYEEVYNLLKKYL
ncbi:D-alanyl-D-alanine carboxypeptidase [Candidatus Kuenenbacteria bacterium]|nr:D-alanyl-D-alanine carboxypeptidase [Candidatus Kuenenbacteria bacterium]